MTKLQFDTSAAGRAQQGFTLVELMVVAAIVGILAVIAYPAYTQYVVKSNRAAAESFILSVANKQEQYALDARQYSTTLAALGLATPTDVARKYTITEPIAVSSVPMAYTITAVPISAQATNDTKCGSVSIDQTGTKSISGTGTVADCW